MLLLLLNNSVHGSIATEVEATQQALPELYALLNASSAADLVHWTDEEIYEWFDEAAKRLARIAGVFVRRDTSIAVVATTRTYNLPSRHISSIHVAIGNTPLRPSNVQELEALDADWRNSSGTPERWYQDEEGAEKISLYKVPTAVGTLNIIHHQYPAEITSGNTSLSAPSPIQDYFLWAALREARQREGDGAMPEVALHAGERVKLFEQVFQAYWGGAH